MSRNAYYSMDHIRAHRIYPPSPPNTATATSTPTSPQNFMPLKTDSSEKWYPSRQQPQIHSQRLLEDDAYFNLDKVVQQYGEQPELLELILSSKLEEDRRRAEEAKLRQKEIDYMLQQQQPLQPSRQKRPAEMLPRIKSFAAVDNGWRNTSPPPPPAAHIQQSHPQEQRRNSSLLLSQPIITTPNATSPSVHTPSTTSTTTNSTPTLPPILSPYEPSVPVHPPYPGPSPIFRRDSASSTSQSMPSLLDKLPIPPSNNRSASRPSTTRRRRRVMQAISTIIETREFPYNDDYLWKNNGNTIHKKTGHRSIYYKCSNSAKGCLVNKTVTFKENGEYLIKYRGEHLEECNRIKRIVDV